MKIVGGCEGSRALLDTQSMSQRIAFINIKYQRLCNNFTTFLDALLIVNPRGASEGPILHRKQITVARAPLFGALYLACSLLKNAQSDVAFCYHHRDQ